MLERLVRVNSEGERSDGALLKLLFLADSDCLNAWGEEGWDNEGWDNEGWLGGRDVSPRRRERGESKSIRGLGWAVP